MQISLFNDCHESKQNFLSDVLQQWQDFLKVLEESICASLVVFLPKLSAPCVQTHVQIILVDATQMVELNSRFRKATYATDVLTFRDESPHQNKANENNYSSDIFICLDTARKQADEQKIPLEQELTLLSIHGILHALDLDHERSEIELRQTNFLERALLKSVGIREEVALSQRE